MIEVTEKVIVPVRGEFVVYGLGEYESWSVLAGQTARIFLDSYPSREEAEVAHPEAVVGYLPPAAEPSVNPPSWFDPLDAGEVWHEDDY